MDFSEIEKALKNEPKYRLNQVKKYIFSDLIEGWDKATSLPLLLREKLKKECPLEINGKITAIKDSAKALIELKDGIKIEAVLMSHESGRNTVCVSSQAGCPLGCVFCATGKMGFKRNLTYGEIVSQVLFFKRWLNKKQLKINNIVFMGMGEPFLNYDNVVNGIRILNDKNSFNIGARHISISTAGITEGIEKFAGEKMQVNLAVSLHASNNYLRSKLMPINKKYPIEKILKAVDFYISKTNSRVMFEYIMIKDINDKDEDAKSLAKLLNKNLYFVNLISYNPTGIFKPSNGKRIKEFKNILAKSGITVVQRHRFGTENNAACGQLAAKK